MKVLVVGNCPLPNEKVNVRPAAGLRTHQFAEVLRATAGVELKQLCISIPECYKDERLGGSDDTAELIRLNKNDPNLNARLQELHDGFKPEVIIGVNTYPSYLACQLKTQANIWADLNGWIMAEAQAQAYKMGTNDYMNHYQKMQRVVLKRADKFSTVSEAQRLALYGELSSFGRIGQESFGYEFAASIPNGVSWFKGEEPSKEDFPIEGVNDNHFKVLWMGGYNTWADEVTLFKALELAMKAREDIRFISTGGEIKGLDDKTFANFKMLIEGSEFRDRFKFMGWVNTGEIPSIYKTATVGINVDLKCLETLTGARNRINEMIKYGLPVITTVGSEISYEVARAKVGIAVKSGDYQGLAEALVRLRDSWKEKPGAFRAFELNAKKYTEEEMSYDYVMRPLSAWLKDPKYAPDKGVKIKFSKLGSIKSGLRYLRENGLKKFFVKLWQKR